MFPLLQLKTNKQKKPQPHTCRSVKHSNPNRNFHFFFFFQAPRMNLTLKASQCWDLQWGCWHLDFFQLPFESSLESCFLLCWNTGNPEVLLPASPYPPQTLQRPQQHSHESETLMSSLGTRSQVSCVMLLPLRRMRKRCQSLFLLSFLDTISQQSTTLMTFKNKNAQPSIFSSSHPKCVWYVYSNI